MKIFNIKFLVIISLFYLSSCSPDFEVIQDLKHADYQLLDIDSNDVVFPKIITEKVGLIGYIFTNCPDICPLTTNNMRLVQEKLKEQNIKGVEFVSISFDPEVDRPSVLKGFADIRNLDRSNWQFLTGNTTTINNLMKYVGVIAIASDSTVFDDGSKSYYYVHTDRIQLIDQEGRIRKNYLGSKINIDEVVGDIKKLL